jgi:hypothetical protein
VSLKSKKPEVIWTKKVAASAEGSAQTYTIEEQSFACPCWTLYSGSEKKVQKVLHRESFLHAPLVPVRWAVNVMEHRLLAAEAGLATAEREGEKSEPSLGGSNETYLANLAARVKVLKKILGDLNSLR